METVYLTYINLTPGFENKFTNAGHKLLITPLREHFNSWIVFAQKYPNLSLGLMIATRKGTKTVEINGPKILKRTKTVEYIIFLPDDIPNQDQYLMETCRGLRMILESLGESEENIKNLTREILESNS
jgi:hypothetical protein